MSAYTTCPECFGPMRKDNRSGLCKSCLFPQAAALKLFGVKAANAGRFLRARGGAKRLLKMTPEARALMLKPHGQPRGGQPRA